MKNKSSQLIFFLTDWIWKTQLTHATRLNRKVYSCTDNCARTIHEQPGSTAPHPDGWRVKPEYIQKNPRHQTEVSKSLSTCAYTNKWVDIRPAKVEGYPFSHHCFTKKNNTENYSVILYRLISLCFAIKHWAQYSYLALIEPIFLNLYSLEKIAHIQFESHKASW